MAVLHFFSFADVQTAAIRNFFFLSFSGKSHFSLYFILGNGKCRRIAKQSIPVFVIKQHKASVFHPL